MPSIRFLASGHRNASVGAVCALAVAMLWLGLAAPAMGDAIAIDGKWLRGGELEGISGGQVHFVTDRGTVQRHPLERLTGLRMDDSAAMEEAEDALAASPPDYGAAVDAYGQALEQTEQEWLEHWINHRLAELAVRAGRFDEAVEAFLRLPADAERWYFEHPPTGAVVRLDDQARQRLADQIGDRLEQVDAGPLRDALERLLELAETGPAEEIGRELVLAAAVPSDDEVTQLIRDGRFREAAETASGRIGQSGEPTALRLYQAGVAYLQLGKLADAPELLKEAGVHLGRCFFQYGQTPYVAAAGVELGYVHQLLGQYGIADRLYQRAATVVGRDQDLRERLEGLQQELEALREEQQDG